MKRNFMRVSQEIGARIAANNRAKKRAQDAFVAKCQADAAEVLAQALVNGKRDTEKTRPLEGKGRTR